MTSKTTCLLLACLLSACEHTVLPTPVGDSSVDAVLQRDILDKASALFNATTGCGQIERVDVSVLNIRMMFSKQILNGKKLTPRPAGGFLLDEQEIPPHGYVQENDERWQMSGCGVLHDFNVKVFGDDQGWTYFGVFDGPPPN